MHNQELRERSVGRIASAQPAVAHPWDVRDRSRPTKSCRLRRICFCSVTEIMEDSGACAASSQERCDEMPIWEIRPGHFLNERRDTLLFLPIVDAQASELWVREAAQEIQPFAIHDVRGKTLRDNACDVVCGETLNDVLPRELEEHGGEVREHDGVQPTTILRVARGLDASALTCSLLRDNRGALTRGLTLAALMFAQSSEEGVAGSQDGLAEIDAELRQRR